MKSYAIKAKIPRNQSGYFRKFRREILEKCLKHGADCVVEFIDGRIILFTDYEPRELTMGVEGVLSVFPVKIYESIEPLVKEIERRVRECNSFAVRSRKKEVEKNIGGMIVERTGKKVNLENPECVIQVEKREKYYLLFE